MSDRRTLRLEARARRSAHVEILGPAALHASCKSLARTLLPHLGTPGILGSHVATGDEIDTGPIEQAAAALGWTLAFPRVTGAAPLGFHLATRAMLEPGFRNIPEPPAHLSPCDPDVILVPLLAADRSGNRLGQGGGHYDRTLASLRAKGPLLAIGVAHDAQIVDSVPAEQWDQPLDAIATPTAFYLAGAGARARK